ncbi:bifunctional 2-polyprenyl-6-hydroxyphenol methylase/3-demethylubiquinol 3-O-methyltransferase UbiG [Streptomyces sp. ISL-86]|uniref:class I SAM-dependent methyltransferase n=1 Tax=Streptomyces sp. ISL-86 TaxID=2819187 RepID=UPI001BEB50F2|nr:class I SAM-dependent methyltransferase [Streptomyces sp. ISL-86]MBT2455586.1 class I SAM-dependent methyltransferase [Streptomyces sp. ISL-86]
MSNEAEGQPRGRGGAASGDAGARGGSEEGVAWSGRAGAQAFAGVEAATDWLLGYPFVFEALSHRIGEGAVVVDYGCGPGQVADRAARQLGARVLGVDTSPEMLALARSGGTAVAEYHLVENGRATGLPDGCADAVMCNHVLASLPTEDAVLAVFAEIGRLLRPGGLFILLTTDPTCTDLEYASLRVGEAGAAYGQGEEMTLRLRRTDGSWVEVRNHAWHVDRIPALLEGARFRDVVQRRPTVDEALSLADTALVHSRAWTAERAKPPLVVTSGVAV